MSSAEASPPSDALKVSPGECGVGEVPGTERRLNEVVRRVIERANARRRGEALRGEAPMIDKATDLIVTRAFLEGRTRKAERGGWTKPRWIHFCETMLDQGFDVTLYEARETVSKYITVWDRSRSFKVRYSNHRPNKGREMAKDCDFFVGKCHSRTTNTEQAIEATLRFFRGDADE